MNKEIAIKTFVKDNFELLKNKELFSKKIYNVRKKEYFGDRLKFRYSLPTDKEICDVLLNILIIKYHVDSVEKLNSYIQESGFLKYNNINAEEYFSEIENVVEKYKLKDSLEELSIIEKIEKLKEVAKNEVSPELLRKEQEIHEKIKQKEEEYRKLPSVLDDLQIAEPDLIKEENILREWWEELNLKENPFPTFDGFSKIPKNMFDDIIVETPPLKWILNKINNNKLDDIFNKANLLCGEFGSGKSTLFDYVSPLLLLNHIESFRIVFSENCTELAQYVQSFEKKVCFEIIRISRKYPFDKFHETRDYEEARVIMSEIQDKGAKGFLIYIDDLHKHRDLNLVFQFLSHLQIHINQFTREDINVSFLISGLPDWQDKVKQDLALRGFFYTAEELTLPEVSISQAALAIRKRLQAFSMNPEKQITIREEYLQVIFKKLSRELGKTKIGFRHYMQEALSHFILHKFDILGFDFTRLESTLKKEIRSFLETNIDFKYSINQVVYGGIRNRENVELILRVLCDIYIRKGIFENDGLFLKNKFAFQVLSKSGLIQKFRKDGNLIWKITPELETLNTEVINKYNLSLEDYLVPIYYSPAESEAKVNHRVQYADSAYKGDLLLWKDEIDRNIYGLLERSYEIYSDLLSPLDSLSTKKLGSIESTTLDDVSLCLWNIMKAIIKFESPALLDILGESNMDGWKLRHSSLDNVDQFNHLKNNLFKSNDKKADLVRIMSYAKDAFKELWAEFRHSKSFFDKSGIKFYELPKSVINSVYQDVDQIFLLTKSLEEYLNRIENFIAVIERTLRKYLLISSMLVFGPYYKRVQYYPENIKQYLTKNVLVTATSHESYNEFENLNRGQYRLLFTQTNKKSEFSRLIIEPILAHWSDNDKEVFFRLFGDLNINESHRKSQEIEKFKKDIPTIFRLTCRFLACLTNRLLELINSEHTIVYRNPDHFVIFGCLHKDEKTKEIKNILDLSDTEGSFIPNYFYQHKITNLAKDNRIEEIMNNLDNFSGAIEIDILDIEATRVKFNLNYLQTIPLISSSLTNRKIRSINIYGTNIFVKRI